MVGTNRREIPQRDTRWAKRIADVMYRANLRPNHISVLSVVFAAVATAGLLLSHPAPPATRRWYLLTAAVSIPLRLLCNMCDGMLAVEKGLHSATGDLYNEIPDRLADVLLLAGAGYAIAGFFVAGDVDLGVLTGWVAASAAVGTAYVRTLGAAQGVGNFFNGPAAKPVRMWILMLACLISIFEPTAYRGTVLLAALILVTIGSGITMWVRLGRITQAMNERAS